MNLITQHPPSYEIKKIEKNIKELPGENIKSISLELIKKFNILKYLSKLNPESIIFNNIVKKEENKDSLSVILYENQDLPLIAKAIYKYDYKTGDTPDYYLKTPLEEKYLDLINLSATILLNLKNNLPLVVDKVIYMWVGLEDNGSIYLSPSKINKDTHIIKIADWFGYFYDFPKPFKIDRKGKILYTYIGEDIYGIRWI